MTNIVRKFSVFFIFTLLLSACNLTTFTFSGESENWSAELKVTETGDDYQNQEFKLQYMGSDINSVGEINYDIDTNAGGFGGGGLTLDENGVLRGASESNPTNAKIIKDSEVEVLVEWNGNSETILLK